MKRRMSRILALTLAVLCTACSGRQTETEYRDSTVISAETENADTVKEETIGSEEDVVPMNKQTGSGQIPEELEQIPEEYFGAASEQGTVERLEYQTWESMSYEAQTTQLTKTAYVYLPYGYSGEQQYNVLYLMHGGWSNEETYLGTPENPHELKNVLDHAIQDGRMTPVIVVCPTYNNTSPEDSADYGLALRLTDNYHNELMNDLIPAVEGKSYEAQTTQLTKTAYVYLPYGYSGEQQYNVLYLMHGGWSNEETYLGTPENPHELKNVLDHAIQDGRMTPVIVVCPTYNNTSPEDSADYGLALRLTDNYHNELMNDLIPAVEGKYRTYAEGTSWQELTESRSHRAFAGFSMGSVTTWHTFQYCMDYFRYFLPSSGNLTSDGAYMERLVTEAGYGSEDFFIYAMSGTEDFAYAAFTNQIQAMINAPGGIFVDADNERAGNLAYRVQEGNAHDGNAALQYIYNGLIWLWAEEK